MESANRRRAVFLVLAVGGFGNQVIELATAMTARQEGETVVAIGFNALPKGLTFDSVKFVARNVNRQRLARGFLKVFFRLLRFMPVAVVSIDMDRKVLARSGWQKSRVAVFGNFFMQQAITFDAQYLWEIYSQMKSLNPTEPHSTPYSFCHVRRTDYASHPSPQFPAMLPEAYFATTIDDLKLHSPNQPLRVYSDDPEWVKSQPCFEQAVISESGDRESWLEMCEANAGILSASSFSLTASLVAIHRNPNAGPFYAPRFWLGWPQGFWIPPSIEDERFTYRDGSSGL